ncbi:hypothetical protein UPYG_G00223450 [Umbra pygmaea]|uniref:Secreted protein n=1 Tax=Umbra pygmaea TaxID=75934 RepID=A0ABD0WC08_UMBPY
MIFLLLELYACCSPGTRARKSDRCQRRSFCTSWVAYMASSTCTSWVAYMASSTCTSESASVHFSKFFIQSILIDYAQLCLDGAVAKADIISTSCSGKSPDSPKCQSDPALYGEDNCRQQLNRSKTLYWMQV